MSQRAKNRAAHAVQIFILACAFGFVASGGARAQVKQHQATGTVASTSAAQVVILKQFGRNTTRWTFIVNAKSKVEAKPAKGARIRIFYHEDKGQRIADRIKLIERAKTQPQQSAPKPSQAASP